MKKAQLGVAMLSIAAAVFSTGCTNELRFPETAEEVAADINERFDFSTHTNKSLVLDMGYTDYVMIYDCDPEQNPEAEPLISVFTDAKGHLAKDFVFPAHLVGQDLWAVGTRSTVKAQLTKNGVYFRDMTSRAIPTYDIKSNCELLKTLYSKALQEGRNNTDIMEDKMTDIDIYTTDGEIGNEIIVSMLDHGDMLGLQLYYYYYKDPAVDKDLDDVFDTPQDFYNIFLNEKYRLFPNADDYVNKGNWINNGWNTTDRIGATEQIKFYGEDYSDAIGADVIPLGYKVGFFLYVNYGDFNFWTLTSQGYGALLQGTTGDQSAIHTSWDHPENGPTYYAGCYDASMVPWTTPEGETPVTGVTRLVFSFEDYPTGYDRDYNDIKFLVSVKGTIDTSKYPKLATDRQTITGTYLFEDLYPNSTGGDYDMNDVVVKYRYEFDFTTEESPTQPGEYITTITGFRYWYTPVFDGATYINDFWVEFDPSVGTNAVKEIYKNNAQQLDRTFSGQAQETNDGTVVGSDDFAKAFIGHSLDEAFYYEETVTDENDNTVIVARGGINPFIYVNDTDRQVHLSKFRYTTEDRSTGMQVPGSQDGLSTTLRYYLTEMKSGDEFYPFAMDIAYQYYYPVPEGVKIYTHYPGFIDWVSSKGTSNASWYIRGGNPAKPDIPGGH